MRAGNINISSARSRWYVFSIRRCVRAPAATAALKQRRHARRNRETAMARRVRVALKPGMRMASAACGISGSISAWQLHQHVARMA